jgi:hypothetical protein
VGIERAKRKWRPKARNENLFQRGWGEAITWWVIKYPDGYDYLVFLI